MPPLTAKICQKTGENQEKSGKKEEKSGRKGKNREVSFTLPFLTDRAGYATVCIEQDTKIILKIMEKPDTVEST